MLINPYLYKKEKRFLDPDSIIKANVKSCSRKIYIIKKFDDLSQDNYQTNTVLLINFSHTKDKDGKDLYMKNSYGFLYYSTKTGVIKEFKNSRLKLNYASSVAYEAYEYYYKDDYYRDLGLSFCKDLYTNPFEINIDDMCLDDPESESNGLLKVPDPRYYTNEHFAVDNDYEEEISLIEEDVKEFYGNDLIDEHTEIFYLGDNSLGYDGRARIKTNNSKGLMVLNGRYQSESYEKMIHLKSIPFELYCLNEKSCFTSYKYNYDSKYGGFNFTDIKSRGEISEYRRVEYLKLISDKLKNICDQITKAYGPIRVMYVYNEIEDCVRIIYDDPSNEIKVLDCNSSRSDTQERIVNYLTDKYEELMQKHLHPYYYYD